MDSLPILGRVRRKEDTASPFGLLNLATQKSQDGLPRDVVLRRLDPPRNHGGEKRSTLSSLPPTPLLPEPHKHPEPGQAEGWAWVCTKLGAARR